MAITIYTRRLLPENAIGRAIGPVILIDPAKRDDEGLIAHEQEHVQQWFLVGVLSAMVVLIIAVLLNLPLVVTSPLVSFTAVFAHHGLFHFVPVYRLWCEVEAYQEQARHYIDDRLPLFASFISTNYKLPITPDNALALLRE